MYRNRIPVTSGRWNCHCDISAVLGVVENYSYFECPDCGKRISLFGESHFDEVAKELGIDVLGKLPLDPKYAQAADEGRFYELENPHLEAGVEKIGNI